MKNNNVKKKILIISLIILLIAIVSASIWVIFNKKSMNKRDKTDTNTSVVAKVGDENLYQKDLDYEFSIYPQKNYPNIQKIILEKMITDSIILQGAKADGLIVLDDSIYNNPDKDYEKRVSTVQSAKKQVDSHVSAIEGYVVSIWYHNNNWVGPLGLEKSKEEAFQKIKVLHDDVVARKITIEKAGERIKEDTSIAQLDQAYTSNALLHFNSLLNSEKPITLNKDLDTALWKLDIGETTDIYPGQATDLKTGEKYDALYFFGQVTNKTSDSKNTVPFDQWLAAKRKMYQVTYY